MIGLEAWLVGGVFFLVLGLVARLAARGITDVITMTALSFALFYGFRTILLVAGLDLPSPSYLFPSATLSADLTRALVGASLFLLALGAGIYATTGPNARGFAPFFVTGRPSPQRQVHAVVFFTVCSALISAWLLARFGSPGALISAIKFDKALAGLYVFRVFPAVGSMLAAGAFVDLWRLPGRRPAAALCLLCAAFNGWSVFLWGSRSLIVVTIVVIVIGLARKSGRMRPGHTLRGVVAVVVASLLVLAVAGALRVGRDTLTHGETQDAFANASTWRQASLATNSVYLDAAVLAFRDVPDVFPARAGTDFANGVLGVVPGVIWADKPRNIAAGSWFRQQYQPKIVNGWPMGAPALWYLNFSWLGVLLGGLVSGLAIGMISARQRRVADSGHNTACAAVAGIFVVGLGLDNQTPIYSVIWLVPLWFVALYLRSDTAVHPGASAAVPSVPDHAE